MGRAADRPGAECDLERHVHRLGDLVEEAEHECLRFIGRKAANPDEDVDHLGSVGNGHHRRSAQELGDLVSRRLACEKGDYRMRVEDERSLHFRSSARRSDSSRRLIASPEGTSRPLPFNTPFSASIGSSGAGRSTRRSPSSSIETVDAPHRARTSAGSDTCPALVIRCLHNLRGMIAV
jgi:hypothetical protein